MTGIIEEISKHLKETKERFEELEHAMLSLTDLVEQLMEKNAKKNECNDIHQVESTAKRGNV